MTAMGQIMAFISNLDSVLVKVINASCCNKHSPISVASHYKISFISYITVQHGLDGSPGLG